MSKTTATKTYRLSNAEGRQGRAWSATYTSHEAARVALRDAMGWTRLYLSPSYTSGETTSSESAYGSLAEMRRDEDGRANAPTIVTVHGGPMVGDRVETVGLIAEDSDAGRVLDRTDSTVLVGWDSGVRTECSIATLRVVA